MPRAAAADSIDSIILSAIRPAVTEIVNSITKLVAERVDAELRSAVGAGRTSKARSHLVKRPPSRTEIRKWTADRRARRVPTFVIEATGLDTKKKIVAKYGENATFERGKPLPKAA